MKNILTSIKNANSELNILEITKDGESIFLIPINDSLLIAWETMHKEKKTYLLLYLPDVNVYKSTPIEEWPSHYKLPRPSCSIEETKLAIEACIIGEYKNCMSENGICAPGTNLSRENWEKMFIRSVLKEMAEIPA